MIRPPRPAPLPLRSLALAPPNVIPTAGYSGRETNVNFSLNIKYAQLVVGAAILDPRYCRQLLDDREGALAPPTAWP